MVSAAAHRRLAAVHPSLVAAGAVDGDDSGSVVRGTPATPAPAAAAAADAPDAAAGRTASDTRRDTRTATAAPACTPTCVLDWAATSNSTLRTVTELVSELTANYRAYVCRARSIERRTTGVEISAALSFMSGAERTSLAV